MVLHTPPISWEGRQSNWRSKNDGDLRDNGPNWSDHGIFLEITTNYLLAELK
jgi:hypothetical protein